GGDSRGEDGDDGEVRRVEECGVGDGRDPEMELVFGVGQKIPPEKFSGGGGGLPEKMTLEGGERENLEESVCIYEMEMKEMK
ncbi:hypothetical protein Tco_0329896, partial [Tanacetum coccineum]